MSADFQFLKVDVPAGLLIMGEGGTFATLTQDFWVSDEQLATKLKPLLTDPDLIMRLRLLAGGWGVDLRWMNRAPDVLLVDHVAKIRRTAGLRAAFFPNSVLEMPAFISQAGLSPRNLPTLDDARVYCGVPASPDWDQRRSAAEKGGSAGSSTGAGGAAPAGGSGGMAMPSGFGEAGAGTRLVGQGRGGLATLSGEATGGIQQDIDVSPLGFDDRLVHVIALACQQFEPMTREQYGQLLEQEAIGISVSVLRRWADGHARPIAWLFDLGLHGVSIVSLGLDGIEAMRQIDRLLVLTANARTYNELREAAHMLAGVVVRLGVNTFKRLIFRGARTQSTTGRFKATGNVRSIDPSRAKSLVDAPPKQGSGAKPVKEAGGSAPPAKDAAPPPPPPPAASGKSAPPPPPPKGVDRQAPVQFSKNIGASETAPPESSGNPPRQRGTIKDRAQALKELEQEAVAKGVAILDDSDPDTKAYMDWAARNQGVDPKDLHASTMGDTILVRKEHRNNVRTLREELIHTDQQREGKVEVGPGIDTRTANELEAREKIVENADDWGISDAELEEVEKEIRLIKERGRY